MLYRPKYCANCGEKIERVDWGIFTSRRFCEVCETEYKGIELLIRVAAAGCLVACTVGIGAYLKSGSKPEQIVVREPAKPVGKPSKAESKTQTETKENSTAQVMAPEVLSPPAQQIAATRRPPVRAEIAEPQYFCGAETKKGTPCSRRVKGNTRCYQHIGMPSMTSSDKLKSN